MRAFLLVLLAALPLGAGEIAFSAAVSGPAASQQFAPAIASNGSGYLVVWSDQRSGAVETWATRVSAEGEILDPTGIRLGAETTCERSVVWTGSEWLVVSSTGDGRLWESRVSAEGEVRHHARLVAEGVRAPSVVQAGAHTVVGYSGAAYPFDPRAMFIGADGRVVADFALASGGHSRQAPQLAWNGEHVVAVWTAGSRAGDTIVEGVRFTAAGIIDASPKTLVSDGAPLGPLIASNGTDYLLVTRDHATLNDSARRVSASLSEVGGANVLASGGSGRTMLRRTGSGYVVIAEDGFSIVGFRLDDDGAMVGAAVTTLQMLGGIAAAATPVVASNGDSLFLAWAAAMDGTTGDDDFDIGFDIYGGSIPQSLSTVETRLLSASAARQQDPLIVSGGPALMTLWSEGSALFTRRIGADGAALDESPVQLASSASSASASFDGTAYVVAWRDETTTLLTTMRVPPAGPIDVERQSRSDAAATALASASDGETTLVGWVSEGTLQVARVDEEGRIGEPFTLFARSEMQESAVGIDSLAVSGSDGNGFLIVWGETAPREDGALAPTMIRGAIVSADLTLLSFPGFEIADTDAAEGDPVVAWAAREWVVGWHRTTPTRSEFRARHIALSGWPVEGTARDAGVLVAANASSPQIAWDGSRYHFAWAEPSDVPAAPRLQIASSASLAVPLVDVTDVGASGGARTQFAVMGAGRVATAYTRIAPEAIYGGVARAFVSLPELQGRRRTVR